MNKNIYTYTILILAGCLSLIMISTPAKARNTDYRFEHSSCIFSYIFPDAPSVIPIWRDDYKRKNKFLRKIPLTQEKNLQGVQVSYKNIGFMSDDKLLIQTYCLTLDTGENKTLVAEDMLKILKAAVGSIDTSEVKATLAQEEVSFVKQENNIRWMSLHGNVQQVMDDKPVVVTHYRDVFAYGNQVLLVMISYIDSGNNYKEVVDNLMRSLILAE